MEVRKILLLGAGSMAEAYWKVLDALGNNEVDVLTRTERSARSFEERTGKDCLSGGFDVLLGEMKTSEYTHAIIATPVETLYELTSTAMRLGIKKILVEKPGFLYRQQGERLLSLMEDHNADVYVAYNRRFYSCVDRACQIIEEDGGIRSMFFEFTEWAHVIEPLVKGEGVKERWFLANSTHVADLAFFLAGKPVDWSCWTKGALSWHPTASQFSGAGITDKQVMFSYLSDWDAPGRWSLEVMTSRNRLIFKPVERLSIQRKGSVAVEEVQLDDERDKAFKPGLLEMTKAFLNGRYDNLCDLKHQLDMFPIYCRMANYE